MGKLATPVVSFDADKIVVKIEPMEYAEDFWIWARLGKDCVLENTRYPAESGLVTMVHLSSLNRSKVHSLRPGTLTISVMATNGVHDLDPSAESSLDVELTEAMIQTILKHPSATPGGPKPSVPESPSLSTLPAIAPRIEGIIISPPANIRWTAVKEIARYGFEIIGEGVSIFRNETPRHFLNLQSLMTSGALKEGVTYSLKISADIGNGFGERTEQLFHVSGNILSVGHSPVKPKTPPLAPSTKPAVTVSPAPTVPPVPTPTQKPAAAPTVAPASAPTNNLTAIEKRLAAVEQMLVGIKPGTLPKVVAELNNLSAEIAKKPSSDDLSKLEARLNETFKRLGTDLDTEFGDIKSLIKAQTQPTAPTAKSVIAQPTVAQPAVVAQAQPATAPPVAQATPAKTKKSGKGGSKGWFKWFITLSLVVLVLAFFALLFVIHVNNVGDARLKANDAERHATVENAELNGLKQAMAAQEWNSRNCPNGPPPNAPLPPIPPNGQRSAMIDGNVHDGNIIIVNSTNITITPPAPIQPLPPPPQPEAKPAAWTQPAPIAAPSPWASQPQVAWYEPPPQDPIMGFAQPASVVPVVYGSGYSYYPGYSYGWGGPTFRFNFGGGDRYHYGGHEGGYHGNSGYHGGSYNIGNRYTYGGHGNSGHGR